MKKKSGSRRRTKIVRRSKKNLRRTNKRKSLGKGRRRPTRRYSRVQMGGSRFDKLNCFVTVGDIYYYGDGELPTIDHDDNMAFKLYKVAAERENPNAQFKFGEMYRRGLGVEKNIKDARRLYQLAAEKGYQAATVKLSQITNI